MTSWPAAPVTSWPSLQSDLRNAGAYWVDRDVVVCRQGINTIVTSRGPGDLVPFCRSLVDVFAPAGCARLSSSSIDRKGRRQIVLLALL